jgi:hypothetical protein
VIEGEEPLTAGQTTILYMSLADDKATQPIRIQLQKTDFAGPGKQKIDARCIQLKPSSFILKPGEEKEVAIQIKLPKNCSPGHYSALITDAENPMIKTVVVIRVVVSGE